MPHQEKYIKYADTTHMATVIDVSPTHLTILEANHEHGVEVRELSIEQFKKYVAYGKAGLQVIKQTKNLKKAEKLRQVAKDFGAQFKEHKGNYATSRFITGSFGDIEATDESDKRTLKTVEEKALHGRYILSKPDGTKKTDLVCSELTAEIWRTAQFAQAMEDDISTDPKKDESSELALLSDKTKGHQQIDEWYKHHKIVKINPEKTTPAAFHYYVTEKFGFETTAIHPETIEDELNKMAEEAKAEKDHPTVQTIHPHAPSPEVDHSTAALLGSTTIFSRSEQEVISRNNIQVSCDVSRGVGILQFGGRKYELKITDPSAPPIHNEEALMKLSGKVAFMLVSKGLIGESFVSARINAAGITYNTDSDKDQFKPHKDPPLPDTTKDYSQLVNFIERKKTSTASQSSASKPVMPTAPQSSLAAHVHSPLVIEVARPPQKQQHVDTPNTSSPAMHPTPKHKRKPQRKEPESYQVE